MGAHRCICQRAPSCHSGVGFPWSIAFQGDSKRPANLGESLWQVSRRPLFCISAHRGSGFQTNVTGLSLSHFFRSAFEFICQSVPRTRPILATPVSFGRCWPISGRSQIFGRVRQHWPIWDDFGHDVLVPSGLETIGVDVLASGNLRAISGTFRRLQPILLDFHQILAMSANFGRFRPIWGPCRPISAFVGKSSLALITCRTINFTGQHLRRRVNLSLKEISVAGSLLKCSPVKH